MYFCDLILVGWEQLKQPWRWGRYFGAAKQLPGVKELFEKEAPRQIRRTRHQLYAHIDADYYGFRDEEDGVLEKVEAVAEKTLRAQVRTCDTLKDLSAFYDTLC